MTSDKKTKKAKIPKPLTLKVAEAGTKDVGRGIVRFDPADFKKIGVEVGDVVAIKGKRETVAKVPARLYGGSWHGLIRSDGITRDNAKTGIDEKVSVKKMEFSPAQSIVVAPLTVMRSHDARYIGSLLEGLASCGGRHGKGKAFRDQDPGLQCRIHQAFGRGDDPAQDRYEDPGEG